MHHPLPSSPSISIFKSLVSFPLRRWLPALLGLFAPVLAGAATITVNSAADPAGFNANITIAQLGATVTLRDAVNAACNAGGAQVINFDPALAGQTIFLTQVGFTNGPTGNTALRISSLTNPPINLTINGLTSGAGITIDGGGTLRPFFVFGVALTLNDLTVTNGQANYGGGVLNQGTVALNRCTLSNNSATSLGGGALDNSGNTASATLVNCTITGNFSSFGGGGLMNGSSCTTTLKNVTVSGNSTGFNDSKIGGGIGIFGGTVVMSNSIVAGNTRGANASDVGGTLNASSDHNLIGTGGSGGLTNGTNGNLVGVADPVLGALTTGVGPTRTMLPQNGSPALNAGATVAGVSADQRGIARPQDGTPDIGAVEVRLPAKPTVSVTNLDRLVSDAAFDLTAAASPNPAGGFFSGPGVSGANFDPSSVGRGVFTISYYGAAGADGVSNRATFTITVAETPSLVVNTTSDVADKFDGVTSLREALAYAATLNGTQAITFDAALTNGGLATITLGGSELSVASNVTITGPSAGVLTVSGNNLSRVLHVASGKTATITRLAIIGGLVDSASPVVNSGGGILNEGSVSVTDCVLSGNTSGGTNLGNGGAIYHHGTALTLLRCTVNGNFTKAGGYGAGIYTDSGTTDVTACAFDGNQADVNGGGIANIGSALTVTNSSFSGNTSINGGAVIQYDGSALLTSCTIAGNIATASGGGLERVGRNNASMTLVNCLIAGNTSPTGPDAYSYTDANNGAFTSQGYNLLGIGDGALGVTNGSNGDQVGTGAAPIDAKISAFGNHGGPTATFALLPGSPAIDAGGTTALTTDQRGSGFARVLKGKASSAQATVDIGAYELFAAPTFSVASLSYAANVSPVNLASETGAAPAGGTFSGAGVSGGNFDPAAAGVGAHPITYTISGGGGATNFATIDITVTRFRGGAVDDAAVNGAGGTVLHPLDNDTNGLANGTITSVSDAAITIGADGRTLIIPAGYLGTFFYTVNGVFSADVTVSAGTPVADPIRWSGLLVDGNGKLVGAMSATKSKAGVYSASVRLGTGSASARFTIPVGGMAIVDTKLGPLTASLDGAGRVVVAVGADASGRLRPALKTTTAALYNIALGGIDSTLPGGGTVTLTVKATADATLKGTLPDGRTFSARGFESDNQTFAFYATVPGAPDKGTAGGELTPANLTSTDVTGELAYTLPPQKKGLHSAGFDTLLTANGCTFKKGDPTLPDSAITLTASGGNLSPNIVLATTATAGVPALSGAFSKWTFTKTTGAFSIKVRTAPAPAPLTTIKGLVLPKNKSAWGFFPGTTDGGLFTIVQP